MQKKQNKKIKIYSIFKINMDSSEKQQTLINDFIKDNPGKTFGQLESTWFGFVVLLFFTITHIFTIAYLALSKVPNSIKQTKAGWQFYYFFVRLKDGIKYFFGQNKVMKQPIKKENESNFNFFKNYFALLLPIIIFIFLSQILSSKTSETIMIVSLVLLGILYIVNQIIKYQKLSKIQNIDNFFNGFFIGFVLFSFIYFATNISESNFLIVNSILLICLIFVFLGNKANSTYIDNDENRRLNRVGKEKN
tara:strand:- start:3540 stop:4286 length:747 start_codon:yes stop_codon:yes gene_type:complete